MTTISVVVPVFRDSLNASVLVDLISEQQLPSGFSYEIVLIDDGSGDETAGRLRSLCRGNNVKLLELAENIGRSGARNVGARAARGEYVVFVDCDCRPVGRDFLAAHLRVLCRGSAVSVGSVVGDGVGFWSRYQADANARRKRQYLQGMVYSGSSQNFGVMKSVYLLAGQFDLRYREYGFEDRDLFIRLSREGVVNWCDDALVMHLDRLSLGTVCNKMHRAAGESAILFSVDHALEYRALGYFALDVRFNAWLAPFCMILRPLRLLIPYLDWVINARLMPYSFARVIVRFCTAFAYCLGSMDEASHKPFL